MLNLRAADELRKKLYLMLPDVVEAGGLDGVMHKAFLAACVPMIDRDSHPHFWCVRMLDKDGNQTEIYDSAMRAIEAAAEDWHRIFWGVRQGYDFERARNPEAMSYRMPDNLKPGTGMDGWFEGAFPGKIISSIDQEERSARAAKRNAAAPVVSRTVNAGCAVDAAGMDGARPATLSPHCLPGHRVPDWRRTPRRLVSLRHRAAQRPGVPPLAGWASGASTIPPG